MNSQVNVDLQTCQRGLVIITSVMMVNQIHVSSFRKSIISSLVACLKKNQIKRILLDDNPAIIYMFKVNNSNTKC